MNEPVYEVIWPLGRSAYEIVPPASRTPDLSGKTVCELWDWLFRGDEIYGVLRELLVKKYPGIKFVHYRTFGNIHGVKESEVIAALPDMLRKQGCDAVISSVGA